MDGFQTSKVLQSLKSTLEAFTKAFKFITKEHMNLPWWERNLGYCCLLVTELDSAPTDFWCKWVRKGGILHCPSVPHNDRARSWGEGIVPATGTGEPGEIVVGSWQQWYCRQQHQGGHRLHDLQNGKDLGNIMRLDKIVKQMTNQNQATEWPVSADQSTLWPQAATAGYSTSPVALCLPLSSFTYSLLTLPGLTACP